MAATKPGDPPNFKEEVRCCSTCVKWHPEDDPNCPQYGKETYPSSLCDDHEVCQ